MENAFLGLRYLGRLQQCWLGSASWLWGPQGTLAPVPRPLPMAQSWGSTAVKPQEAVKCSTCPCELLANSSLSQGPQGRVRRALLHTEFYRVSAGSAVVCRNYFMATTAC